jgi:hypothetical protein
MKACEFLYRQHRSVTTTVKNTLGHFYFSTVVKYMQYTLNRYLDIYKEYTIHICAVSNHFLTCTIYVNNTDRL